MPSVWFQRNPLLVMSYLSLHKGEESIHGRKLAAELDLSQGSVSTILRQLESIGVVTARPVGRTIAYRAVERHPLLRALRVFENQLILQPFVSAVKEDCRQIILFGSCATGDDDINSDIDLFILADDPEAVRTKFANVDLNREVSPVIVSPMEMALMETNDKVFLNEIRKGQVLWEATDEER
jgi:predicted nucleotidyltransferase